MPETQPKPAPPAWSWVLALLGLGAFFVIAVPLPPETSLGPDAIWTSVIALAAVAMAPLAYLTARDSDLDWFERSLAGLVLVAFGLVVFMIILAGMASCAGVL